MARCVSTRLRCRSGLPGWRDTAWPLCHHASPSMQKTANAFACISPSASNNIYIIFQMCSMYETSFVY
ncbi:Protein of unknown function [Gryllus bimaculatus]|nr:Protein of unknown function [Gryllus bimaculatus]